MITSTSTRRSFVAALIGIGLTGGSGLLPRPLMAATGAPLPLPDRPLRLQRLFERGLGSDNGAAIIVRRSWEVGFERQARGIVVSGRQIAAEVSAPPSLAQIARIEQQRDASTMFPLMLAEDGAIMTAADAPSESDEVTAALQAAEAIIARQTIVPSAERARMSFYLAEVHRAGSGLLDVLPGDLMFPTGMPIDRIESVALPDGLIGRFGLHYSAAAQANAPWLARAERQVVTSVGGAERRASEVWTLGPL